MEAGPYRSVYVANPLATSREKDVFVGSILLIVLPTVFVLLRILSRLLVRAGFWVRSSDLLIVPSLLMFPLKWDDVTIVFALV